MTHGTLLHSAAAALGWFASAWSFLSGLLPEGESLDNRCGIDPDGGPCGPGF
ncbi:MAG TPA: hypothetical protein VKM72_06070 [Thermoanaerobaculia bacterium]|nr:hypothetical protein [Thermoanaerobaculia bacterium]